MNEQSDLNEILDGWDREWIEQRSFDRDEILAIFGFSGTEERISIGPRASYFALGFACGFLACLFFLVMAILG